MLFSECGQNETVLEDQLLQSLLAAFQRFQNVNVAMTAGLVSRFGIGTGELRGLLMLNVSGPIGSSSLAERLGVNPSTVTFLVNRLVRAGYVIRVSSSEDRRSHRVTLTADGAAVVAAIWSQYAELFVRAVPRESFATLTETFDALSAASTGEAA